MFSDSALSIKDASGRQISLLNDCQPEEYDTQVPASPSSALSSSTTATLSTSRRKYHCTEPGCNKSFTTSGHLARHNRIHTGEKNFHCLHPGCPSRFSRQDNMMQHYRTHLSPKSRKQPYHSSARKSSPLVKQPLLHCHTQIANDHTALHPLNQPSRPRRAMTLPSTFHHPYPHPAVRLGSVSPPPSFARDAHTLPRPRSFQPLPRVRPHRTPSTSSVSSASSTATSPLLPSPSAYMHSPPAYDAPPALFFDKFTSLPPPHALLSKKPEKSSSDLLHLAHIVSTFG